MERLIMELTRERSLVVIVHFPQRRVSSRVIYWIRNNFPILCYVLLLRMISILKFIYLLSLEMELRSNVHHLHELLRLQSKMCSKAEN